MIDQKVFDEMMDNEIITNVGLKSDDFESVDELMEEVSKFNPEDVFVCGGASVYNLLMDNFKNVKERKKWKKERKI